MPNIFLVDRLLGSFTDFQFLLRFLVRFLSSDGCERAGEA